MTNDLRNKIAIITGGSGGIGSVVCFKLAQLGAKVAVHYGSSEDAAKDIVARIQTKLKLNIELKRSL